MNRSRRAYPAAVRAALRSRSRHAYARVTEACDAITYPDGATYNYTYDTESGRVAAQQRGTHRPTPCGYNRLIEVRDAGNALIVAYSYDPFGRRLSKDTGNTKTYFFYNAEGLIVEADATGVLTKSYGYAPNSMFSTNPLWLKTGTAYYTYQNDHLGTPMKVLNQSGAVVWSATYDAFGKATVNLTSTVTNNLRFPGQYEDAETGLHYNWMRYYDPATGRYVTSDPIGLRAGLNLYTYVGGNPLKWRDSLGLYQCTYAISAHTMTCTPDNPNNPPFTSSDYVSGNNNSSSCPAGGCQNNPSAEGVQGHGPLPEGTYQIGPQNTPVDGCTPISTNARCLTPINVPRMRNRSGFQIHGCPNSSSCSKGCVAVDSSTSNATMNTFNSDLSRESNSTLKVVP